MFIGSATMDEFIMSAGVVVLSVVDDKGVIVVVVIDVVLDTPEVCCERQEHIVVDGVTLAMSGAPASGAGESPSSSLFLLSPEGVGERVVTGQGHPPASDDNGVIAGVETGTELPGDSEEAGKLSVDSRSNTASGERSLVTFEGLVPASAAVNPASFLFSVDPFITVEELIWLMENVTLLLPDDGVETVTVALPPAVPAVVSSDAALMDVSVEVEFIAAVMFNPTEASVLF